MFSGNIDLLLFSELYENYVTDYILTPNRLLLVVWIREGVTNAHSKISTSQNKLRLILAYCHEVLRYISLLEFHISMLCRRPSLDQKKIPTVCCPFINPSLIMVSNFISWSVVDLCFLKPLWWAVRMAWYSRYQTNLVFTIRSKVLQNTTCESNWTVVTRIWEIFSCFGDWDDGGFSPLGRKVATTPDFIVYVEQDF